MSDQLDTCELHNWWYDQDLLEVCPECIAEKRERERIIALLETEATIYADGLLDTAEVIALIKGENE